MVRFADNVEDDSETQNHGSLSSRGSQEKFSSSAEKYRKRLEMKIEECDRLRHASMRLSFQKGHLNEKLIQAIQERNDLQQRVNDLMEQLGIKVSGGYTLTEVGKGKMGDRLGNADHPSENPALLAPDVPYTKDMSRREVLPLRKNHYDKPGTPLTAHLHRNHNDFSVVKGKEVPTVSIIELILLPSKPIQDELLHFMNTDAIPCLEEMGWEVHGHSDFPNSSEAQTPEAQTPEAHTPEAQTEPEADTPEAETSESRNPETETSELQTPEAQTSESQSLKAQTPEEEPSKQPTPQSKEEGRRERGRTDFSSRYSVLEEAVKENKFAISLGASMGLEAALDSIRIQGKVRGPIGVIWVDMEDEHGDWKSHKGDRPMVDQAAEVGAQVGAKVGYFCARELGKDGFHPAKNNFLAAWESLERIDHGEGGFLSLLKDLLSKIDPKKNLPLHLVFDVNCISVHSSTRGLSLRETRQLCKILSTTRRLVSMDLLSIPKSEICNEEESGVLTMLLSSLKT